jgi:hypothetical protein
MHPDRHEEAVSATEAKQTDDLVEQARELTSGYKLLQYVPADVAVAALSLPVLANSDLPELVARRYCSC